ncbi:hypothetical protein QAD02_014473 [Eretmocerus hayati]|uniref:Uncharacterized protein n=1 Tax=Eretmocerus hayati TaxID=131215 RepID=A0ACC2P722_9HYME|nr:hypothetical protein QAD02_014473 [Eretmocerus hayati]
MPSKKKKGICDTDFTKTQVTKNNSQQVKVKPKFKKAKQVNHLSAAKNSKADSKSAKRGHKFLITDQSQVQVYKKVKTASCKPSYEQTKNKKKDHIRKEKKTTKPSMRLNIHKLSAMLHAKEDSSAEEKQKKPHDASTLRERMLTQLKASRFRFLNEHMYSNESSSTKKFFEDDPQAFYAYHEGYKQQVERWPVNPVDVIIESIKKMPQNFIIADFGCGEAKIAESVPHTVHSFDLVSVNDKVKACDMAHTPLLTGRVNVVVFCLSLMGSNLKDYLLEANRVLAKEGTLKVAEVESRFHKIEDFIKIMAQYGFENTWKDLSNNLFYFMDFKKVKDILKKSSNKLPDVTLKPCMYKKR